MSAPDDRSEKERELTADNERLRERNERLSQTLREARDGLVEIGDWTKNTERHIAIGDALDYAILAVDMRISECKAAIARGLIGQEADRSAALARFAVEGIFETALRASGYEIVPLRKATS